MSLVLLIAIFPACTEKKLREEKHPNGALKARGYIKQDADKNDVLIGRWTFWHPNGQKEAEGEYRNGRDGGKRGATGILVDGRDGFWTMWYSNGQVMQSSEYKDGRRVGVARAWDENGKKKSEEMFKDDKWDGLVTFWYGNSRKSSERTYKDGKMDGQATTWYENGQKESEGTYKGDKEDGSWTFWYANGQRKLEGNYKNGEKEGHFTSWFENGKQSGEATIKGGTLEGIAAMWDENGKKTQLKYVNGQPVGLDTVPLRADKKDTGSGVAASTKETTVVADNNDALRFGKPTIKTWMRMTRVIVQAQNITDSETTCLVRGTFLSGETIVGSAVGALNRVRAGSTKTVELITSDNVAGYDTLRLEASNCF